MNRSSRRSFMNSAVAAAGLGLASGSKLSAQTPGDPLKTDYLFSARQDVLARIDRDGTLLAASPWAIVESDQDLLPYLNGQLAVPLTPEAFVSCGTCSTDGSTTDQIPVPQRFLDFRMLGEFPSSDLIGDIVTALTEQRSLDFSITVFDQTAGSPTVAPESGQSRLIHPNSNPAPPNITAFGYKLQFRGPDYEGMIGCAPEAPKHYHVELQKQNVRGGWDYVFNLHLAFWKQAPGKYCFAVANSVGWPSCIRICNPTWTNLYQTFLSAFLAVGIVYWISVGLASLIASALYGSLALLAA